MPRIFHPQTFSLPTALVVLSLATSTMVAKADDLPAHGNQAIATFVAADAAGDGSSRDYYRLATGETATFLFCGQGRLRVLSRALLGAGADAARYSLDLRLDGAEPSRELAYRATATGALFDDHWRAGTLKRATVNIGRGCHTAELSLAHSTAPAVGVRLSWSARSVTKRKWQAADAISAASSISTRGGTEVDIVIRDQRTPYRLLEAGRALELDVDGPAWVRLLVRPLGHEEEMDYSLAIDREDERYRHYRLENAPSGRARLSTDRRRKVGRPNEVVFAVGPGRQALTVRASPDLGFAIRAQVADQGEDRDEDWEEDHGFVGTTAAKWTTRARLASYYDSNILRYSDKFIQRFDNGQDPDRFRVESLDDVIHRADVYASRGFGGIGQEPARITLGIEHRAYQRNSIKDWTRFELAFEQELRRGRKIGVFLDTTTDFYVRHLRDSDLVGVSNPSDRFQGFEFERSGATLRWSQEVGASSDLRVDLGFDRFRHSSAFREFDSDNLALSVRLNQQVSRALRLSYAVEFTQSDAQGYDEPGETLATSDDTDPSYEQWDLMLAARIRLPTERRQTLFFQAEAGQREYTTNKPSTVAPLHSGREDDFLRLYGSWQIALGERYSLTVFAQSRDRSSTAPIQLDIGVEKDYEQWEAGVRFTARFGD